MAWSSSRGAYSSNHMMSTASMDCMLMKDEALDLSTHMQLKKSKLHQRLPFPFFSFRDVDNKHLAGSTAGGCSNIMQAMETMKRPLFWPFLDVERVKGSLSPDHNVVNEQSASTSEFYNVSNTAMMERMLRSNEYSNEEVEMNMNEGESRIRKKKRLTGEQVCALEGSFKTDKKLEAQRKQELAQRLGLEPRQVAVWFQNRRARSKTKHLEHDFALLQSKYHYMLAETHKLRSEVSRLTAELEASRGVEAGGAKPGAALSEIQLAPIGSLQVSGSNQYNTKSNNIMDQAAHIIYEGSNLLSKSEGNYIVINGMKQSISISSASPSMSCSPENSHEILLDGKSSDYNTSPAACISEGDKRYIIEQAHCSEPLPAICFTDATTSTYRFEHVDTNHSSLPHLKKVNDIHILQASHHLNFSGDDCLHPLISHHHVALDCLWELTT